MLTSLREKRRPSRPLTTGMPSFARRATALVSEPLFVTNLSWEWEGGLHKRVSASDQETRDRAERGSVVTGSRVPACGRGERTRVADPPPAPRAEISTPQDF